MQAIINSLKFFVAYWQIRKNFPNVHKEHAKIMARQYVEFTNLKK